MALFSSVAKGMRGWQEGVREKAPSLGKRVPSLPPISLTGKRGTLEWVLSAPFLGTHNPMLPTVLPWKAEQTLWVEVCAPFQAVATQTRVFTLLVPPFPEL